MYLGKYDSYWGDIKVIKEGQRKFGEISRSLRRGGVRAVREVCGHQEGMRISRH